MAKNEIMKNKTNTNETELTTNPRSSGATEDRDPVNDQQKIMKNIVEFPEHRTLIELPFELTCSRHIGCYKPLSEKQCEPVTKWVDTGAITNRLNRFRTTQPALFAYLCESDPNHTRERILATLETGAAIWQAFTSKYGTIEPVDDHEINRAFKQVFRITASGECYICKSGEPELLKRVTARVKEYCPDVAAYKGPHPTEPLAFHLRRVYTVEHALVTKIKAKFGYEEALVEAPEETNGRRTR